MPESVSRTVISDSKYPCAPIVKPAPAEPAVPPKKVKLLLFDVRFPIIGSALTEGIEAPSRTIVDKAIRRLSLTKHLLGVRAQNDIAIVSILVRDGFCGQRIGDSLLDRWR